MTDPNQELAKKIVERLVKEGLLNEKEGNKIIGPLAQGKFSQDDWKVAFEKSAEKEKSS